PVAGEGHDLARAKQEKAPPQPIAAEAADLLAPGPARGPAPRPALGAVVEEGGVDDGEWDLPRPVDAAPLACDLAGALGAAGYPKGALGLVAGEANALDGERGRRAGVDRSALRGRVVVPRDLVVLEGP